MLVLPPFELLQPTDLDEALEALAAGDGESMLLGGGTDLVPNLKHGLAKPKQLISLKHIEELSVFGYLDGGMFLGAGLTLDEISTNPLIDKDYPALTEAAAAVASPQIRRMGTLGGNLNLDTRCVYFNQTAFWRQALGYCLKLDGTRCHVIPKGSKCVAAFSADTPGPLIAYGAQVHLASATAQRRLAVSDFFAPDGINNNVRRADEIVTGIWLPPPKPRSRSAYFKLRLRQAIDFPALSISAALSLTTKKTISDLTLVVGGLQAKPRIISRLDELVSGQRLDDKLKEAIASHARRQCHPVVNLDIDADWRRDVLPVYVKRLLDRL